jgi:hypothetical protein
LVDTEAGYQAYYQDELALIESEEPTAWLTKSMGVVLDHKVIRQYHRMDAKQRRKARKEAIRAYLVEERKKSSKYMAKRSAIVVWQEAKSKSKATGSSDFVSPPAKKPKAEPATSPAPDADFKE